MGGETAQTELGPPMGGIGWAIGSLGRDVQGSGLIATAILRPAVLLEKGECGGMVLGFGFIVLGLLFSVMGWETAQTELGPPMGGIPRLGGRGYIGRAGSLIMGGSCGF